MSYGMFALRIITKISKQEVLCHPEAACFDEAFWPKSFALDLTEGSRRERRRLIPIDLDIEERFFLPDFKDKSGKFLFMA